MKPVAVEAIDDRNDWRHNPGEERELPAYPEEIYADAPHAHDRFQAPAEDPGEVVRHLAYVGGEAADEVARGLRVKEANLLVQQRTEESAPHAADDALLRHDEEVPVEEVQHGIGQGDHEEAHYVDLHLFH
eukprot:8116441-Pyramimonas_sp.AAC.1